MSKTCKLFVRSVRRDVGYFGTGFAAKRAAAMLAAAGTVLLSACVDPSAADATHDGNADITSDSSLQDGATATNGANAKVRDGAVANSFVIVMLGDSLTAGLGLAEHAAPPARIERLLNAQGVQVTVINAGVSGDTTAGGLARYDWSVASAEPDLLVIALGANDYLQGVPAARAKANLDGIINRARDAGLPIALIGLAARTRSDPRDRAYGEIYPALAKQYGAPLYPAMLRGVRDDPTLLQSDGLHPTAAGAAIVADQLADFLTPLIALSE